MRTIISPNLKLSGYIVKQYGLKKDMDIHAFTLYKNSDMIACTESGLETIGYIAGRYGVTRSGMHWLLYLIGAFDDEMVLYPHTIKDSLDYAIYQERLFRHPFSEGETHCPGAVRVYRAAARFWPLHQILFLQVPQKDIHIVMDWFLSLPVSAGETFTPGEEAAIQQVCTDLRLTHAMRLTLEKLCAANPNFMDMLVPYNYREYKTKQERAKAFGELRQKLQ